jgi:hypothetical protein
MTETLEATADIYEWLALVALIILVFCVAWLIITKGRR